MANGKDATLTATGALVGGSAVVAKTGAKFAFLANPVAAIGISLGLSWLSRLVRRDDRPVATIGVAQRLAKVEDNEGQVVIGEKGTRTPARPLSPGTRQYSIPDDNRSGWAWDYPLLVSDGSCLGLERNPVIWVDGEYIPLVEVPRTEAKHPNFPAIPANAKGWTNRDDLRGRGSALARPGRSLMVYEYLDGGVWSTLSEVGAEDVNGDPWPDDREMVNLSGLHIRLWEQPLPDNPYPNEGNEEFRRQRIDEYISHPVWPSTQNARFEALWGGVKITWPGQPVPTATSNAACIRWWYERTYLRIPTEEYDRASVEAAVNLCAKRMRYYQGDDYLAQYGSGREGERAVVTPLYEMNGIIFSGDNPARIADEMDFAWDGHVFVEDGARVFRPGQYREPIHHLDESLFSEPPVLQVGGVHNAVYRGVRSTMAQSEHDFRRLPASASPAFVFGQERRPAEVYDIGTRALVTNHYQMARLNYRWLQRLREPRRYVCRIPAQKKFPLRAIRLGDPVSITAPSVGAKGVTAIVMGRTTEEDKAMRLVLAPDINWREPAVFPPLQRRSAGTTDPGGGGVEPPDPTVEGEPGTERPPAEN